MNKNCDKMLPCGHVCCGFKGEGRCLPCLDPDCVKKNERLTMGKTGDDYCSICYSEGYNQGPCVQIGCGHIFHVACIFERIKLRWPGPRIVFNFLNCTECQQKITAPHCPQLHNELTQVIAIEDDVKKKSLDRAKHEEIDKHP